MSGFYSSEMAMSSDDDTWATPADFFDKTNQEFGFGLDAAALQNSTKIDSNWYGPDHPDPERSDAFKRDWTADAGGKPIWLNPPYGRTIKQWMEKADAESKRGATVICLVPARTDTTWFQDYCLPHKVRFIRGRLKFGNAKNAAPFPSALVIMN